LQEDTVARPLSELNELGIKPDWWKLEPQSSPAAWAAIEKTLAKHEPWCRGVLLLGLDAPAEELEAGFAATASASIVKGFAVGRTIFMSAAEGWLSGKLDDEAAIADMAGRFKALTGLWLATRGRKAA
jgi:5-dehydro-2-deoxygluconokinase